MSLTADDFQSIQKFLLENSAVRLASGKEYLVEGRLQAIVYKEDLEDLHALINEVKKNPNSGLSKQVLEAMLTNETSFFRDRHPFETLKTAIIPALLKNPDQQIRIWSAACSSGQEPYSLALLLADSFSWIEKPKIKIVATDISASMLEKCQSGLYTQFEILRGLPPHYLPRFFERADSQWKIKKEIRDRIEFRYLNLYEQWEGLLPMDIVFIRNVLIYFNSDVKMAILEKIRTVLKPGGYLFLGSGETPDGFEKYFESTDFSTSSCYKLTLP